jgi:hypothetical protein
VRRYYSETNSRRGKSGRREAYTFCGSHPRTASTFGSVHCRPAVIVMLTITYLDAHDIRAYDPAGGLFCLTERSRRV